MLVVGTHCHRMLQLLHYLFFAVDRFWANEEIYYNYKANKSCAGSRKYDIELQ